jgi:hypothetical protein
MKESAQSDASNPTEINQSVNSQMMFGFVDLIHRCEFVISCFIDAQ